MKNYIRDHVPYDSLITLFVQAPVALGFLQGENFVIAAANPQILEVWGKGKEVMGKPLIEALPELEGQIFIDLLKGVYTTGIPFKGNKAKVFLERKNGLEETFFNFIYAPVYNNEQNEITGISIVATEVTDQVESERKLEETEYIYEDLLKNSNYSTAVYRSKDLIIDFANDEMLKTWGKDASVIHTRLEDALPELEGQPFIRILKEIFETGEAYYAQEDAVDLEVDGKLQTFYYNFSYKPLKKPNGEVYAILNNAVNVTELVLSRKKAVETAKLLETFMNSAPMAVSVMEGEDFRIMLSNDTTRQVWGGPKDRIGKTLAEAYPGIEQTPPFKNLQKVLKTGKEMTVREYEVKDQDSTRFLNYILHPLKNEEGKVEHIISLAYDVTEDLLIKIKIQENEERFRILANSMPQFVWTADKNGSVDFFNDKWYEYTGFERSISGDQSWKEILKPEDFIKTKEIWMQSVLTGNPYEVEYQFKDFRKPGEFRWFLGRAVPVKDADGNVIHWVGTCTDIDEFKQLQKQKDNFLGITSHELKTPLTSLKLYSQFIERNLRKAGDEKNADVAKKMDIQVNKLTNLITDLLDVTKIQNGRMQLNKSNFDFDETIEEIVEEQQMSARHRIRVEKNETGEIFGDRHRISQVMSNLISNAIKYSPDADEILVKAYRKNGDIKFSVRDYGIGIPEDKHQKVFEQYYRVSGTKEHTFPGLGLGLYISSEIIKRSGGRIYVNKVEGKGTEFCFELPVAETE